MGYSSRRLMLVIAFAALAGGGASASAAVYGPGIPTRAEYVARAEAVCTKTTKATDAINAAATKKLKNGDSKGAGKLLVKASRVFGKGVAKVRRIPRPRADRKILARWLKRLKTDVSIFAQLGKAVGSGDNGIIRRVASRAGKHGRATNRVVRGFGFKYCLLT